MELLIFLVGRPAQLVWRKEIVVKLWRSDLFVDTETNINNIVRKTRAAAACCSSRLFPSSNQLILFFICAICRTSRLRYRSVRRRSRMAVGAM
jgi:hypothetical protein